MTHLELKEFEITDPFKFLAYFQGIPDIRLNENQRTIIPEVVLYDVYIDSSKNYQNVIQSDPSIPVNIKQGNTVIQILDRNGALTKTAWARRGVSKPLPLEFKDEKVHLEPILQQINGSVSIYSTVKLNGYDAQISWQEDTESWVLGNSKYTLLAQNSNDAFNFGRDERTRILSQIGVRWFDYLETLSSTVLENLKQDLRGRTLCGVYLSSGRSKIVPVEESQLKFYGIVELNPNHREIPLLDAMSFFAHYKLNSVEAYDLGTYTDIAEIKTILKHRIYYTLQSDIQSSHEGVVFQIEDSEAKFQLKLVVKSLEYRLFELLLQTIQEFYSNPDVRLRESINKYKLEAKKMCKFYQPSRQLDFYYQVAESALTFANNFPTKRDLIIDDFAYLICSIFKTIQRQTRLELKAFQEQQYIELNLILPETLNKRFSQMPILKTKKTKLVEKELTQKTQKTLLVMMPIGLNGMGKSTLAQQIKNFLEDKPQLTISSIDYEQVRADNLKKLTGKQSKQQKQFQNTQQIYEQIILDELTILSQNQAQLNHIIFLDRTHTQREIDHIVQFINSNKNDIQVFYTVLYPLCHHKFNRQSQILPFSFTFYLHCMIRVLGRIPEVQHESAVAFLFQQISYYQGVSHINITGVDCVVSFPFVVEDKEEKFADCLEDDFIDTLIASEPTRSCNDKELLQFFLQSLKDEGILLHEVDQKKLYNQVDQLIMSIYHKLKKTSPLYPKIEVKNEDILPKQEVEKASSDEEEIKQDQVSQSKEKRKRTKNRKGQQQQSQLKKPENFNPTQLPTYLGIQITDGRNQVEKTLTPWLKDCFINQKKDYADTKFKNDTLLKKLRQEWKACISMSSSVFELSKPLQVVTFYIGLQGESARQVEYFYQFRNDLQQTLHLRALVASPDNFICGLILPTQTPNQNKFPHINLFSGQMKPKEANEIISIAIQSDPQTREAYKSGKILSNSGDIFVSRIKINYKNKQIMVYVISADYEITLEGVSRAYF